MNDGGGSETRNAAPSTTIGRVDMDAGAPPESGEAAWSTLDFVLAILVVLIMVGALTLILTTVFHVL